MVEHRDNGHESVALAEKGTKLCVDDFRAPGRRIGLGPMANWNLVSSSMQLILDNTLAYVRPYISAEAQV